MATPGRTGKRLSPGAVASIAFGGVALASLLAFILHEPLMRWRSEWYPFGAASMALWPTSGFFVVHGLIFAGTVILAAAVAGGLLRRWFATLAGLALGLLWSLTAIGSARLWMEWRFSEPLQGVARNAPPDLDRYIGEAVLLHGLLAAGVVLLLTRSWIATAIAAAVAAATGVLYGFAASKLDTGRLVPASMSLWQVAMAAIVMTWAWRARQAAERARDRFACRQCGYSLAGLPRAVCPECGAPAPAGSVA